MPITPKQRILLNIILFLPQSLFCFSQSNQHIQSAAQMCISLMKNFGDLMIGKSIYQLGINFSYVIIFSVQFSCPVMSDPATHGLQHTRLPCPSPTPGAYSNSCPSSQWCHPSISSSVIPFSSHLQSFPASGSFLASQFFTSGGQYIGVSASASVFPMNIQDWFPLG